MSGGQLPGQRAQGLSQDLAKQPQLADTGPGVPRMPLAQKRLGKIENGTQHTSEMDHAHLRTEKSWKRSHVLGCAENLFSARPFFV